MGDMRLRGAERNGLRRAIPASTELEVGQHTRSLTIPPNEARHLFPAVADRLVRFGSSQCARCLPDAGDTTYYVRTDGDQAQLWRITLAKYIDRRDQAKIRHVPTNESTEIGWRQRSGNAIRGVKAVEQLVRVKLIQARRG